MFQSVLEASFQANFEANAYIGGIMTKGLLSCTEKKHSAYGRCCSQIYVETCLFTRFAFIEEVGSKLMDYCYCVFQHTQRDRQTDRKR